jgi:glycerophosphoryl diester phosphodiesterase
MIVKNQSSNQKTQACFTFLAALFLISGASVSLAQLHRIDPQTSQGLQELFKPNGEALPFVSAHRGGPLKNIPENSIAAFENTLKHTYGIMELDPRYTKDGAMVVHHDPTLNRTTTGKGPVANQTLAELKQLRLKDPDGNATNFQIPTLDEVLEWARGKTILILDQKDVPMAERVKKIIEHKAEGYAMVIVYSFKEARACYALNTNIMMEVMIPNAAKAAEFEQTGVPWRNVVAFVGHTPPQDAALFGLLHQKGASCILGTSRNLDRNYTAKPEAGIKTLEKDYRALLQQGADILETDIPTNLGPLLYGSASVPVSKKQFFHAPY